MSFIATYWFNKDFFVQSKDKLVFYQYMHLRYNSIIEFSVALNIYEFDIKSSTLGDKHEFKMVSPTVYNLSVNPLNSNILAMSFAGMVEIDLENNTINKLSSRHSHEAVLNHPIDIDQDVHGNLYVIDRDLLGGSRLLKFSPQGEKLFVKLFPTEIIKIKMNPEYIAVLASKQLTSEFRVQKYDFDGNHLNTVNFFGLEILDFNIFDQTIVLVSTHFPTLQYRNTESGMLLEMESIEIYCNPECLINGIDSEEEKVQALDRLRERLKKLRAESNHCKVLSYSFDQEVVDMIPIASFNYCQQLDAESQYSTVKNSKGQILLRERKFIGINSAGDNEYEVHRYFVHQFTPNDTGAGFTSSEVKLSPEQLQLDASGIGEEINKLSIPLCDRHILESQYEGIQFGVKLYSFKIVDTQTKSQIFLKDDFTNDRLLYSTNRALVTIDQKLVVLDAESRTVKIHHDFLKGFN